MKEGYKIEYHKQGTVIQLTSKCCGAKIITEYQDLDNGQSIEGEICSKCGKEV